MKFKIVFTYMDGETYELDVHPNDMEQLMASLGKSEVYFNDYRGVGVWIPIDKVRYFQVERQDEQGRRVMGSNPEVQSGEGAAKGTDGFATSEGSGVVGDLVLPIEAATKAELTKEIFQHGEQR